VGDRTAPIADFYLRTGNTDIVLAVNANQGDYDITLVAGHGVVAGEAIYLNEGNNFYEGKVLGVVVNVISLDTPLGSDFSTASGAIRTVINANVDGSVTPVIFTFAIPAAFIVNLTRFMFYIEDSTVMDDAKFGGLAALTNGVVFRHKVAGPKYWNLFNSKSNGELAERMYDVAYADKSPAGSYGLRGRRTFGTSSKNGAVIQINGAAVDEFQMIVQDDLTGLDVFHLVVQGYFLSGN